MFDSVHHAIVAFLITLGLAHPLPTTYQGYGEGEYVLIAPQIAGTLQILNIERGQQVHKGDALFTLDHTDEAASLDQAKAALKLAHITYARDQTQIKAKAISQAIFDADKSVLDQAKSTVTSAQWRLDQKIVTAPADALVFDTLYRVGEFIPAGQAVASLLPPPNIKARFFVAEPDLAAIPIGTVVQIQCDNCAQPIAAHVTYRSPQAEFSPPQLYNRDNRERLLYMLEATPDSAPERIHPGQPVDVLVGSGL